MQREALARWVEEGRSLEAIGRRLGKHPSTVSYWLEKHGLEPAHRARHAARGGIPRETLEELVARDLTIREIAAEVDRSTATVRYWLAFHGLRTTREARRARRAAGGAGFARCPVHGEVRHVERNDGRLRCSRCNSEAVSRRRREIKRILVEEAGGACAVCGYDRWVGALHFHHLDPSEKRFNLGLKGLARALDAVRAEAAKCVLLCANCHAEVEGGVVDLPR